MLKHFNHCLDLHFSQLIIYSYRISKFYLKIINGHTTVFCNLSLGLPFYLQKSNGRNVIAVFSSGNAHVLKAAKEIAICNLGRAAVYYCICLEIYIFICAAYLQFLLFPGCDSK